MRGTQYILTLATIIAGQISGTMEKIINEVQGFFERYPSAKTYGKMTTADEIKALPRKIRSTIPYWYKDLLLQFPIANLPLGIPSDFGQPLLKGRPHIQLPLMEITFYSIDKIIEMSDSIFPNFLLFKKKVIGIAKDEGSTGEGIFIDSRMDNPPVTMIFHDMGESVRKLVQNGVRLADCFSDLFTFGKLTNDKIELTNENRKEAINLITSFFQSIDREVVQNEDKLKTELSDFLRLTESMQLRDSEIENEKYVAALLRFEWGLYDSGYPLTRSQLDHLINIYKECGLHIPELVFMEERVGNYGG